MGTPAFEWRDTALAVNNNGLWRAVLDGGVLKIQKNTAAGGDFSTLDDYLAISTAGNVGIGTSSPTEKLDVENGFSLLNSQADTVNRNYGPVLWSDKSFGMELGYDGTWSTRIFTRAATEAITFGRMPTTATLQSDFVEWARIQNGNVGIGTSSFGTSAATVLGIANGTAPGSSPANMVQLYSEDVSLSAELKVRDEAGNVTTLSPHNFDLIPEGPSEPMAWAFHSERDGKAINVDMLRVVRLVEELTGEKLVYTKGL